MPTGGEAVAAAGKKEEETKLTLVQKAKALAGALPPAYWQALIVVSLLYFARFDASFITLRAKTVWTFGFRVYGTNVHPISNPVRVNLAVGML